MVVISLIHTHTNIHRQDKWRLGGCLLLDTWLGRYSGSVFGLQSMSAMIIMCSCVSMCKREYMCVCGCMGVPAEKKLSAPNCCLLSHCQSDYEILFNLLGGRDFHDFDESNLLFLHSPYCLVVRCLMFMRSSALNALLVSMRIEHSIHP